MKILIVVFISVLFVVPAFAKKTVCSITINSPDEIESFKNYLGNDFDFVELTSFKENKDDKAWLSKACKTDIECDVLVISGHFGGAFFGQSGLKLGLDEMETSSCNAACNGIFHHPKDVYLFGCNTLAGKENDHRTPEQYRQVLINDGFMPSDAEQIVAFRYSPLGHSFHDRMANVFKDVPNIFGFSSVGPSGKTVKPLLKKFFENLSRDRVNYGQENYRQHFLRALKTSSVTATQGASEGYRPVCFLSNPEIEKIDKLIWMDSVLRSEDREILFTNIPYASKFFSELKDLSPAEKVVTQRFQHSQKNKEALMGIVDKTIPGLMGFQVDLVQFMSRIEWLTPTQATNYILNLTNIKKNLDLPTREYADTVCSLDEKTIELISQELKLENISNRFLKHLPGLNLVICLRPKDPRIADHLVKLLLESTPEKNGLLYLNALFFVPLENEDTLLELIKLLQNDTFKEAHYISVKQFRSLRHHMYRAPEILLKKIYVERPELRSDILQALHMTQLHPQILQHMAKMLLSGDNEYSLYTTLLAQASWDPETVNILARGLKQNIQRDSILKILSQNTISPETVQILTDVLKTENDLDPATRKRIEKLVAQPVPNP